VLSRCPIINHLEHDLSWKTCETALLQRVDIDVRGHVLHVYNVHLGTADPRTPIPGRAARDDRVRSPRQRRQTGTGDFNEWMRGMTTTLMSSRMKSVNLRDYLSGDGRIPDSFDLHLDHIYYAGALDIEGIELPRTGCRWWRRITCRSLRR
jgi:endonuclease/exonuclease/phosphatase family metal-dependent hydrolase